ncbi:MAG: PspA/IM30 family protein [Bacteroidota bacterium]|nr:PspA/IM30 family protein [Bacteroidota bacterium]
MSLWPRFKRAVKSIFGGAISSLESPKLILEQNIRELNEQVPRMNRNIADVKANLIMLQKEERKLQGKVADLTAKIKASIQNSREDLARQFAIRLEAVRADLEKTAEQLAFANKAYEKALQVRKVFMRERERKINEARDAMRAHERAKWQSQIADALHEFEVGGLDNTHGEMINRLEQETARNEAKMELALDSLDAQALQLEEDSEQHRADAIVEQMKLKMGLASTAVPKPPVKGGTHLDPGSRTMGRNSTS